MQTDEDQVHVDKGKKDSWRQAAQVFPKKSSGTKVIASPGKKLGKISESKRSAREAENRN